MPVKLLVVLTLLFTLACYPDKKCSGELVFDDETALCYGCPSGAKFKNGTCECMPGYEFVGLRCVLKDGAMPPMPDAGDQEDGGETSYEGMGCKDYCAVMGTCIGGNSLAVSVLPDIVSGLHANDAAACESKCKSDLGSNEATDAALKCIVEGAEGSMCTVADPQAGLTNSITLIGQCCGPNASSPLCTSICAPLKANALTSGRVDFCP